MQWQAAEAWNKASQEEKAPHVAAADREKEQYERLCDEYAVRKEAAAAAAMARHLAAAEVWTCMVHLVPARNISPDQYSPGCP